MTTHSFTKKEEIAHAITHGIGALLCIPAVVWLIFYATMNGSLRHVISVTIFGATMFLMYVASTLSHGIPQGKWKHFLQIADHSMIYLFIAGTYTPFLLIPLQGEIGWILFSVVWGIAIAGIIFKIFFVKQFLVTSTIIYIIMGWLIVFAWEPLVNAIPPMGVHLLICGGILYTIGTIFYMWRRFHYHHVVWHLFVIAGSSFHFFTILFYIV